MADKVTIELEVLAKRALDDVEKFSKTAQKQLNSISMASSISAINAGFELVGKTAGTVLGLVSDGFGKAASEALEAEAATVGLANALKIAGDFSAEAIQEFETLASSIQRTTTVSDDAVLSAAALAKAYQLSNAEARNVVKVATDLSARLGIDLQSATEKVAKTMTGFVDRDLGRMIPGLKALSEQQLIAGNGLLLIQDRVRGSAAALTNSLGGALQQLKNNFNDVFEEFGKAVIQAPEFTNAIKALGTQFGILAVEVARAAPDIANLVSVLVTASVDVINFGLRIEKFTFQLFAAIRGGFQAAVNAIGGLVEAVPAFIDFLVFSSERGAKKLEVIFSRLNPANFFKAAGDAAADAGAKFDPIINAGDRIKAAISGAAQSIETFNTNLEKTDGSAAALRAAAKISEEQARNAEEQIRRLRQSIRDLVEKQALEVTSAPISGLIRFAIKGQEELDKTKRKIDEAVFDLAEKVPPALRSVVEQIGKDAKKNLDKNAGTNLGVGFASAIISGVKKGAAGAAEAVSGVVGGVASAFFGPVIGQLIQQTTEFLAQGPEQVKKQIREFELAVPDVVQAIIESIPAAIQQIIEDAPLVIKKIVELIPKVIDSLIASIPKIVQAFIDAIPQIMETLAQALPRVFTKIATIWPQVAAAFIRALIQGLPGIFKIMATEFLKLPKLIAESIVEAIKEAFSSIGNLFGGGGGGLFGGGNGGGGFLSGSGIPIISDIGDFLGLAGGGRIPDLPQYEGDRFPARLNAGEQVLSKDLSSKLDAFLAGQGGSPQVVKIMIGQREMAQVLLDLSRNGFRTA